MKGDGCIPKVVRGYVRQDFSDLLNELHGGAAPEEKRTPTDATRQEFVSSDKRRKASLMDNPRMLYAYSIKARTLHDRDCMRLGEIPNSEFQMLSEFDDGMNTCPWCYRRALIRSGVGDDRRHISAFERFFGEGHVLNAELYVLMIENKAQLKWISGNVVQIKVREDTWQISRTPEGYRLWHNNYIRTDDGARYFTNGFHPQTTHCWDSLSKLLIEWVVSYSWEKHVEKCAPAECSEALVGDDCKE